MTSTTPRPWRYIAHDGSASGIVLAGCETEALAKLADESSLWPEGEPPMCGDVPKTDLEAIEARFTVAPADVDIYAGGPGWPCMSVCVPADLPVGQVVPAVRRALAEMNTSPLYRDKRWQLSKQERFHHGGQPHPCVCDEDPARRHWLVEEAS